MRGAGLGLLVGLALGCSGVERESAVGGGVPRGSAVSDAGPRADVECVAHSASSLLPWEPPALIYTDCSIQRGIMVLFAYQRMSDTEFWPGFDPTSVPVALWDGEFTFLGNHPAPPDGYRVGEPMSHGLQLASRKQRDPAIRANSSAEIGGVLTATLLSGDDASVPAQVSAAVLIHEAFHVFQDQALPGFTANEALLFEQPVDDADWLHARRAESECLRRAWLARSEDPDSALAWGAAALSSRARLADAGDVTYTRGLELREGTAQYVQFRAHDERDEPPVPAAGFAAEDIRERGYATGEVWARLLDMAQPGWATEIPPDGSVPLDEALRAALAALQVTPRALPEDWLASARQRAAADAGAVTAARADRLEAYLTRPGTTLVLQPRNAPLWPERFDPLNVEPLVDGQVLHTRWLVVANGDQRVECEGLEVLSLPAGGHPLFEGLAGLVLTGLDESPEISTDGSRTSLRAPGLTADLVDAEVLTDGERVIVRF